MGKLTTQVLDTAHGIPGAGIGLALYRRGDHGLTLLGTGVTNADGRCEGPLLAGGDMICGRYRLVFEVGGYFAAKGCVLPDPPFVETVVLDFGVADAAANCHVPLLVSPWSFSTYRGR